MSVELLAHIFFLIIMLIGLMAIVTALFGIKPREVLLRSTQQTGGYAPGWRIRCLTCNKSKPATEAGIIRIGAKGSKRIKAHCSQCQTLVWAVIEPEPEQRNNNILTTY